MTVSDENLAAALRACVAAAAFDPAVALTAALRSAGRSAFHDVPPSGSAGREISRTTLLYAASLSKQVVGVCFALVTRAGLVSPADNLARWFPQLPEWAAGVQLGQLLTHTGALPEESALLERMRAQGETARTTRGMIAALHGFEALNETPGTSYSYSNIGYVCLARIVELASAESLVDFANRRIFEPLGMDNTRFWPGPDSFPAGAAPVDPEPIVGLPFSLGDGGLWTTTVDFLRWCDAMNRDELGVAGLVQQTGALNDGTPLDYAWGLRKIDHNGYTGWSHGGSWPGIFAKSVRFPELQASFVAFTLDTDIDPILRLTDRVQDMLCDSSSLLHS